MKIKGTTKVTGAIFDADGTLLDSMHIWRELGQRYLKKCGITAQAGLADILYPMSLEESSAYLKKTYGLLDSIKKITDDTVEMIEQFYLTEVNLKPGVKNLLEKLEENHIPMIVATSNDKKILMKVFRRLNIADYFGDVLTCSDLTISKREATIYLEASKKLGTKPEDTVVFEDVLHGIESAKSAGFQTVAIADFSNVQDQERLRQAADYYIRDFTDSILETLIRR